MRLTLCFALGLEDGRGIVCNDIIIAGWVGEDQEGCVPGVKEVHHGQFVYPNQVVARMDPILILGDTEEEGVEDLLEGV